MTADRNRVRVFEFEISDIEEDLAPARRGINEAADCLIEQLKAGKKVLLHCVEGRNRSGAVAIRAIRKGEKTSFDRAKTILREGRREPYITNPQFLAIAQEDV